MPVSPKEARDSQRPDEDEAFAAAVKTIDEHLLKTYMGGEAVTVELPASPGLTIRVYHRLVRAYEGVGWGQVGYDSRQRRISLVERAPSCSER